MITIQFVKAWLKYAALTVLAVVIERGTIRDPLWFATITGLTVLIFTGISLALYREWRAEQRGNGTYHYQFVQHLDHD
ncbi:hypothetical protein CFN78_08510 [Amycolatopsis antarctica]|uniref:Uncharacterized protein n=1 Tax=Amycolatopsis antarctica TaxID=1854586 RepID=A0A263D7M3_9PSEU|nr:hypothetical protein [Amycolatopsis antarctica]OZM73567.1 hypothetical protein CFN78_08510 [Amycolatopsis antarctica]